MSSAIEVEPHMILDNSLSWPIQGNLLAIPSVLAWAGIVLHLTTCCPQDDAESSLLTDQYVLWSFWPNPWRIGRMQAAR